MRAEKQLLLNEIKEKLDQANDFIVVKYNKLTPEASWKLSESLSKTDSSFTIVKKRLFNLAAKKEELGIKDVKGNIGVVFINGDLIDSTKAFVQFKKDNGDMFEIITGKMEGRICSAEDIDILSQLPSKNEMRSQFLVLLEAPMTNTLLVLEESMKGILYCLENKKAKSDEKNKL